MKKAACFLVLVFALSAVYADESIAIAINGGWSFMAGDNLAWSQADFDDSAWRPLALPGTIDLPANQKAFWLRATVSVAPGLRGDRLWFETGKTSCAVELYANGVYLGTRGGLPPAYYVRQQQNNVVFIPDTVASSGTLTLALRCYYEGSQSFIPGFHLVNREKAESVMYTQNFFNMQMYIILSVICLFLGVYFSIQFLANTDDRASLFYSLSLIFIAIYFFDMGSERVVFGGLLQRAVARSSLSASLGFMMLFFMKFFRMRGYKTMRTVVFIDIAAFAIAFLVNSGNDTAVNAIFNLSLLPVFAVIIYAVVVVVQAAGKKDRDAWPILIGLVIGIGFGIHDIAYQVLGKDPFAWLQGFTFFLLNLSVFIAMSARAARAQKEIRRFTDETTVQRDRLSQLMGSVQNLVTETEGVAVILDDAVSGVAGAADQSAESAGQILLSASVQAKSLEKARDSIDNLLLSLVKVNKDLQLEAASIDRTAGETARLMAGFASVGELIKSTVGFTESLDGLTKQGSDRMSSLFHSMERVLDLSKQIKGVVDALNDFAERTNLLAMNASIEAAHAGNAGRGFAVIAQEIKKLSAASAERANKIGGMVADIDEAVSGGFEATQNVKASLEAIASGAAETAGRIRSASDETEKQRKAGKDIATEAEDLAASAQRMILEVAIQSQYSETVGASMNELTEAVEKTRTASVAIAKRNSELTRQSKELRSATDRSKAVSDELSRIVKL